MSLLAVSAAGVALNCWAAAAHRFDLPVDLLYSIAAVESSYNPKAVALARNGTYSIGLMQINSSWFRQLERYGVSERQLFIPCVNIHVGAWILAQEVARYGYKWEALGAYYAGPYDKRSRAWKLRYYREYASKVLARWIRIRAARASDLMIRASSDGSLAGHGKRRNRLDQP